MDLTGQIKLGSGAFLDQNWSQAGAVIKSGAGKKAGVYLCQDYLDVSEPQNATKTSGPADVILDGMAKGGKASENRKRSVAMLADLVMESPAKRPRSQLFEPSSSSSSGSGKHARKACRRKAKEAANAACEESESEEAQVVGEDEKKDAKAK